MKNIKYTAKEKEQYKSLNLHLKILEERAKQLRLAIKKRKKDGYYNMDDPKKLLNKIRKAKREVADAGFI